MKRRVSDVLRKRVHVGIVAGTGQNGGVPGSDCAPTLTLQSPIHDSGSAIGLSFGHQLIDEVDEVVG